MLREEAREFLVDHPRVTSALFTLLILLSQVGTVVACGDGHSGP